MRSRVSLGSVPASASLGLVGIGDSSLTARHHHKQQAAAKPLRPAVAFLRSIIQALRRIA